MDGMDERWTGGEGGGLSVGWDTYLVAAAWGRRQGMPSGSGMSAFRRRAVLWAH